MVTHGVLWLLYCAEPRWTCWTSFLSALQISSDVLTINSVSTWSMAFFVYMLTEETHLNVWLRRTTDLELSCLHLDITIYQDMPASFMDGTFGYIEASPELPLMRFSCHLTLIAWEYSPLLLPKCLCTRLHAQGHKPCSLGAPRGITTHTRIAICLTISKPNISVHCPIAALMQGCWTAQTDRLVGRKPAGACVLSGTV